MAFEPSTACKISKKRKWKKQVKEKHVGRKNERKWLKAEGCNCYQYKNGIGETWYGFNWEVFI